MSEKVRLMFNRIAGKYDLLNNLLSLGIHKLWKRKAVRLSKISENEIALDCASGTGDIAILLKQKVGQNGKVLATDFSEDMLQVAKAKFDNNKLDIQIEQADAMALQFDDNSFDTATIAFGIRNVNSTEVCLGEMARVVKPGKYVVVLEFGQPKGIFSFFYKLYSRFIIPLIGKIVANDKEAYQYLNDTAAVYPCRNDFIEIMQRTGKFSECRYYTLTFGIAFIYTGKVK